VKDLKTPAHEVRRYLVTLASVFNHLANYTGGHGPELFGGIVAILSDSRISVGVTFFNAKVQASLAHSKAKSGPIKILFQICKFAAHI
jgi:hypothetical protein